MKFVPISQLDTTNPGTWPIYYRVIVWIALIAAILGLYYKFVRMPLMETQEFNQQEITKLEGEYKTLYQTTLDIGKYVARANDLVKALENKLTYLPAGTEVPKLIDQIYESAVSNSINFNKIAPLPDARDKYYDIKPIQLEAKTGYQNFAQFSQAISSIQRILNVSDIKIIMTNSAKNLDISGTLQTYVYNFDLPALKDKLAKLTGEKK